MSQLADAINEVWIKLYGGVPTTSEKALATRIKSIADDRDCWLANARANQKENNRLEAEIKILKS